MIKHLVLRHRVLHTALVVSLAVGVTTLGGTAEAADLTTCNGKPVTAVISSPSQAPTTGTAGDDVIVVTGAGTNLNAKDGNDSICVVAAAGAVDVAAGYGNDFVSTVDAGGGYVETDLGYGDDVFAGGPGPDELLETTVRVVSGEVSFPSDNDVIATGAGDDDLAHAIGDDVVDAGPGDDTFHERATEPTAAAVSLGDGNDRSVLDGLTLRALDGGAGTDRVRLSTYAGALAVDAAAGTATQGAARTSVLGFEEYEVLGFGSAATTFVGSDAAETLFVQAGADAPVTAAMAGGDDVLEVKPAARGRWDGGPGADVIRAFREGRGGGPQRRAGLRVDLGKHRLQVRGFPRVPVVDFEGVTAEKYHRVELVGSGRGNRLLVVGCRADVRGGGGNDVIVLTRSKKLDCDRGEDFLRAYGDGGKDRILGNTGADRLFGGNGPDVLRGRQGSDVADGGSGGDRCAAERRISC